MTPQRFFIVNDTLAVPASSAAEAKRNAIVFAPRGYLLGAYNTRRARPATAEETASAQAAWTERAKRDAAIREDRESNPMPTTEQLLEILEAAAAVIYEQAHPSTAGQAAYDRAQDLRNGRLAKAIAAIKRDRDPQSHTLIL